jgi:tetraether lipid synthase
MAPNQRPYRFYDTAVSLCSTCLRRVDAKIVFQDGGVWMLKRCGEHGAERVLIADDIDYYRRAREVFIKTPEQVASYNTPVKWGCPYDCGICPDHEQHGCNLLIEVTDHCNLRCPTCYASSGPERLTHRSLEQIERMLDLACANEIEPDIVQISGGEPTVHPEFWAIMDMAAARPIKHLMVNTNGIKLAEEPGFAERLASYKPETPSDMGLEVYLQFDSFERGPLMSLRAADLRRVHDRALDALEAQGIDTNLVMTVRRGLNDQEIGKMVEYAASRACVRGLSLQPVQVAGRLDEYEGGYDSDRDRLTLTEVRRMVLEQTDIFAPEDIIPVPCHADSIAMAYAMKLGDEVIPLTGMVEPELLIEGGSNTILYEQEDGIRESLFDLFSTHHSMDSQSTAMQSFLEAGSDSSKLESLDYRNVFRLLIVEFIDAHNFDLRSIRKSCVHIVHPDAKRVIPFDTYNMLYRDELEETVLAPIRAERPVVKGPLSVIHKHVLTEAAQ